jgi:hypothetical protein
VADKALLHNTQFVIIRPIPAAFTIGCGQNFDLRAVDKVGHKVGLTIGANPRSDGRPRRLTANRDIAALIDLGLMRKGEGGGRSTHYELVL